MLTNIEIFAIVFVVLLAAVVAGVLLYLLRRLRQRRAKLLSELSDKPELNQDRAFNRLAMARREAEILGRQGTDIRRAQELIAEAQGAFDTKHYEQAYRVAQSAHEALVNARQMGTRLPSDSHEAALPGASTAVVPSPAPAASPTRASATTTPSGIPKNRAESQFQIRLLGEELDGLPARRNSDPTVVAARSMKDLATAAFGRGDFTEAFKLALKGRRSLGGSVESLPPTGSAGVPAKEGPNGGGDAASTAETVAGADRCPDCGYPALAGDSFCRGCGRPRAPLTCSSCGAPRAADEPFCGRCGARFT